MSSEIRCVPDALLERYLTDSLSAADRDQLEARLMESPRDRARLEELRADSAAFLIQHPPAPLVARFRRQRRRRGGSWHWPTLLTEVLLVGAAVGMLLVLQGDSLLRLLRDEPDFSVKGSVVLVMYRKEGDTGIPVSQNARLAPNDALRFEVRAPASGYVAVLSRDGRGAAFVYYPFDGVDAALYDASQPLLPGAIELDDTLGQEDVYALYSAEPFGLEWAVEALRQGRLLKEAAERHVSVGQATFVKEPRVP
ncbi:DUF4384 domain-containing protein [Hyalangium minutum]|uniref:Uncharacterized protein n=1 Tax=Hyalangium minutum TaxID=394096 RepID=A0A085WJ89_9BACT|nr:DUF4384 domain-containing protein [Hyalangium minutum]KFE67752.1 hypothetical protein DB31_8235 [Hyalangium minutum]